MGISSADARKLFLAKVKPGADDALKKNRAMADPTKEMFFGVEAVLGTAQVAPIQLLITKLKAQTVKVEDSLASLDACIAKVADFSKAHKAVLSELPEVDKLNDELAVERRRAATWLPAQKAAQAQAEKALKALANSRTELNAEWAKIETAARKAHTEILTDVKSLTGHRDKARVAVKAKDAKALADAKGKAEMMPNPYLSDWPAGMKKKLADFAARYEKQPQLDKDVLTKLTSDKKELGSVLERIALNAKLIESIKREVSAIK